MSRRVLLYNKNYGECCYTEGCNEDHYKLSAIKLNYTVMLGAVMQRPLYVVNRGLSVIKMNVVVLSVVAPCFIPQSQNIFEK